MGIESRPQRKRIDVDIFADFSVDVFFRKAPREFLRKNRTRHRRRLVEEGRSEEEVSRGRRKNPILTRSKYKSVEGERSRAVLTG
jgi:hypothetical protein